MSIPAASQKARHRVTLTGLGFCSVRVFVQALHTFEHCARVRMCARLEVVRGGCSCDSERPHQKCETIEHLAGTDIHTLARQIGTSVRMFVRHYSKLTAPMAAERLA